MGHRRASTISWEPGTTRIKSLRSCLAFLQTTCVRQYARRSSSRLHEQKDKMQTLQMAAVAISLGPHRRRLHEQKDKRNCDGGGKSSSCSSNIVGVRPHAAWATAAAPVVAAHRRGRGQLSGVGSGRRRWPTWNVQAGARERAEKLRLVKVRDRSATFNRVGDSKPTRIGRIGSHERLIQRLMG